MRVKTTLLAHDAALEEIHRSDEFGDGARIRSFIEPLSRVNLIHPAAAHDGDAVGKGERLFLVMRDEDEGDADFALELAKFDLHLLAQLLVECAQRFVEQQNLGIAHERARERNALALAARELVRPPVAVSLELDQAQGLVRPAWRCPPCPERGSSARKRCSETR